MLSARTAGKLCVEYSATANVSWAIQSSSNTTGSGSISTIHHLPPIIHHPRPSSISTIIIHHHPYPPSWSIIIHIHHHHPSSSISIILNISILPHSKRLASLAIIIYHYDNYAYCVAGMGPPMWLWLDCWVDCFHVLATALGKFSLQPVVARYDWTRLL